MSAFKPVVVGTILTAVIVGLILLVAFKATQDVDVPPLSPLRDPANGPARIVIVSSESSSGEPYDASVDQEKLSKPAHWCAAPRAAEPLLREAAQLASGNEDTLRFIRDANNLSRVPIASVRVVVDEPTCEAAAKAYDRLVYSGWIPHEEHTALHPVLVVAVGEAYLVDDLGDRDEFWNVIPFDRQWNVLMVPYGGGA